MRILYTYENGLEIEQVSLIWEEGAWINRSRKLTVYENGLATEVMDQVWDGAAWMDDVRTSYTFQDDLLVEWTSERWFEDAWTNERHFYYSEIEDEGLWKIYTHQVWDEGWVNEVRIMNKYEEGLQTEYRWATWDGEAWVYDWRQRYIYEAGLQVEVVSEEWLESGWELSSHSLLSYDQGLLTESLSQTWFEGAWLTTFRRLYTYEDGLETEYVSQRWWEETGWENRTRWQTNYEDGLEVGYLRQRWEGEWVNINRKIYTYATTTSVADEAAPSGRMLSVYPNPTSGDLNAELSVAKGGLFQVKVFDGLGREVRSLHNGFLPSATHVFTLEDQNLAPGLYIIRVTGEGLSLSRRVAIVQ